MTAALEKIETAEGRFARFEAIEWWDQLLLQKSRVLVVGAGALGNEVIKNLALLGIGNVVIADMDKIELSNLSRSILFRESDEGKSKAECAAQMAKNIYPEMCVRPFTGNVLADLGLGYFRWADVVIGALDNREARVFVNSACARVSRPWIDGGIEVLHGIVRGFAPPATACYECTMSKVDWDLLNKRRSCSLLARRAIAQRGTPTTPTTASVIGAMQVQELVKHLHGLNTLLGRGFIFDGAEHSSYNVAYQIDPQCGWHEQPVSIEAAENFTSQTPLKKICEHLSEKLGGIDALDLSRELVERLECPSCGQTENVFQPAEKIQDDQIRCGKCGAECSPIFFHSIPAKSPLLEKSAQQIGLPNWDVLWARYGADLMGVEIAGDNPFGNSARKQKGDHGFQ
jgi:adenylyltransferase/sulfurtransferase